uniref:probable receptor-like protein kinase At1g67000 n=1 Tax=Fragaria vesca subsp. vesca TaxID=101020 RepID=UPI0005C9C941|nr:PREDICTED: probable receptor-like protein kinase At1g67000 [Fragaria vesca subsp. vesca]
MLLNFLWWLLIVVELVHGGVGLEHCIETRCKHHGPTVRFPFRIRGSQPNHCGYEGFDISCTNDKQTVLEVMPLSASKFFVKSINYASQEIEIYYQIGCPPQQVFDLISLLSSSPFKFVEGGRNYTLFSCPSSKELDEYRRSHGPYCVAKLGSCNHGSNPVGNQFYTVRDDYCTVDSLPLVSCTKVHDYYTLSSVPDMSTRSRHNVLKLQWSKPSCQHCEEMGMTCRFKSEEFRPNQIETTECLHMPKGHPSRATLKILGTFSSSVILIVTGAVIYYIYSSKKAEDENQLRIERFLDDYRALKPSRYSYADIKRITKKFEDKLGQGAYGTVYKGKLSSDLFVAVKILDNSNEKGGDFINEVGTMGRIYHVNVVRLVGFCADGYIRALIYEFLPNGSLQNFLSSADSKNSFLGWDRLQDIALGVAKGIEYLHQGCDQRILHFDIKPHNVLLDEDFTPKVSDFGLAKLCSKDQSAVSMTAARGTMGYIAPEVFSRNFGNVSYKSDVYSFGTLLLEMVGGRKNFRVTEDSTSQVYFPEWIYNLLEEGNDLRIHMEDKGDGKIARKLAIVGLRCIQWHPVDRPPMKLVVQMLEREGDNLTMPPNPFATTSN